jgi:hypothetical protein
MDRMKKVIIESPYAGDVERNIEYAKACMRDSLNRGEAPLASHLLYTQVLDDTIPEERELGIAAGLAWLKSADLHVFYVDYGFSTGMAQAFLLSVNSGIPVKERKIYPKY